VLGGVGLPSRPSAKATSTAAMMAYDDGASFDRLLWFIANQAQEPSQAE
jgi:hypothetical protein